MSDSLWLTIDRIATFCGLLAFIGTAYSAYQWWRHLRRERQLQQPVAIRLVALEGGTQLYVLPFQPPRRIVTRAEVLGLLGMIPSAEAGKRFEWAWLHEPEFMRQLEEIHLGQRQELHIPVTEAEFAQLVTTPRPAAG